MSARSGYVYFLRNPATGLTKIGQSIEPHVRRKALEAEYGPLEVLAVAKADDAYLLEQRLHKMVEAARVEGEWFKLNNPLEVFRDVLADRLLEWSEALRVPHDERTEVASKVWQLRAFLDREGITPYRLAKHVKRMNYPAVYRYANGNPKAISFTALGDLLNALCEITGRRVNVEELIVPTREQDKLEVQDE